MTRAGRAGQAALALAGAVAAALTLSGCIAVPTSGAIQQGAQVDNDTSQQIIRVIARPPSPGMSPVQIVQGFISASASFEGDHAVARQYLTPGASLAWNPGARTVVYEGVPTLASDGSATVNVTATQTGQIQGDGSYAVSQPGQVINQAFTLAQEDGEWRINAAPPGLLLARSDVDRAYRTYDLFFVNPDFTTLVPDPRMVPVDTPGTATSLARLLTQGPSEWLAPAVRTGFPDGTGLAVDAVPVVDGIARVDLDASVRLTDDRTRQIMSAQLTWTLQQVPGVRYLDLAAGGQALSVPGVTSPQPIDSWQTLDPNAMPVTAEPYAVVSRRVVELREGRPLPVSGGAGLGSPPLDGIAVSLDGELVAGLDADGSLWTGPMLPEGILTQPIETGGLSRPSFGRGSSIWVIGPEGKVLLVAQDGKVSNVPVDGLSAKVSLESLAISRDGTRAALTVRRGPRSYVMLATIVLREGAARLQGPVRVENRLTSVTDVAWSDDNRLLVVGAEGASDPLVYEIDLTRAQMRDLGTPGTPLRVAGAPGFPTLVATSDDMLSASSGGAWQAVGRGGSPAYPGS